MAKHDFLESFFELAKKKFKPEDIDKLFRSARAASGGRGKKRKRDEREEAEKSVEKALIERPLNSKGFGTDSTLTIVEEQGKFSQEDSRYIEPARSPYETCGACRFYLRDENSEVGRCQVVEGDIAWFATCDYFISAESEASVSFEASHPQVVEETSIATYTALKEDSTEEDDVEKKKHPSDDEEVEKKVMQRGDKWVVTDSSGKKVLGTHDSKESALKQLRAIEANKSAESTEEDWTTEVDFYKKDEEKQLVFGIVMEPEAEDTQGDFSTEEEIEKAAHLFLRKSRIMGKAHELRAKAEVVESYIAREATTVEGQEVKKGSWLMVSKIHDAELWQGVKSGEFTGYSIAGKAIKTEDQIFGEEDEEEKVSK